MSHLSQNQDLDQNLPTLDGQTPLNSALSAGPACCSLQSLITPVLVLATLVSICAAAYFAGHSRGIQTSGVNPPSGDFPLIDATAAVTSEKYSMATGPVSAESEGLFVLDHNSGLLQCHVIYPKANPPAVGARFTANVAEPLGTGGKGGKYMMVSGAVNFRSASNSPAAPTVIYVMDTATGNYACYGIPFNDSAMNAQRRQEGGLVLLAVGAANPVIDRDNLR